MPSEDSASAGLLPVDCSSGWRTKVTVVALSCQTDALLPATALSRHACRWAGGDLQPRLRHSKRSKEAKKVKEEKEATEAEMHFPWRRNAGKSTPLRLGTSSKVPADRSGHAPAHD